MGVQSIMVTKILLVGFVLCIQKVSSQAQAPPFRKIGCPVNRPEPPSDLQSPNYCFYQNTTCVPTKNDWPYQFDNRHRGSIYRKIRTPPGGSVVKRVTQPHHACTGPTGLKQESAT